MHNKLWVTDNVAAIAGSRNLGDEYFDAKESFNFLDVDLLAVGPITSELSQAFDAYWNSAVVIPVEAFLEVFLADLEGGRFDGAWLVQNFESLRPEGVFKKYDTLFAHPEAERDRFLEFERWWNGYYFLGREEILTIVRDLFIGNRLASGEVVVDEHCTADLTRIRTPLVLFSSFGDNITPPHQALAWLRAVYPSTDSLVAAGQRVVYLLHRQIGHMGIFVSADVAKHEHRAILHHAKTIAGLAPGLYEMQLDDALADADAAPARFIPRRLEDITFDPRPSGFEEVRALSERLDALYAAWLSPMVRTMATPVASRLLEQSHPMRVNRRLWSSHAAPALTWLPWWLALLEAGGAEDTKRDGNPWFALERGASDAIAQSIESWRTVRDQWAETLFERLYPAIPGATVVQGQASADVHRVVVRQGRDSHNRVQQLVCA